MKIIGHRGAAGFELENTISSFKKAIDLQLKMIELDVFKCNTGELVVFHDETVDKLSDGKGRIEDLDLSSIRLLKLKNGEGIPLLSEVLDLIDMKLIVNIELKGKNTANETARLINEYIKNGWNSDFFLVSSFHIDELVEIKANLPNVRRGILIKHLPNNMNEIIDKITPYSIHPYYELITVELVSHFHQIGLFVFAYTVNTKIELKRMQNCGVDGIFSDYLL